jgi:DeoR/GlpR family transcriptional regulator of sugar metabolism
LAAPFCRTPAVPELQAAGEHTIAELAELFAVSRPTVYRVLERHRASTTNA